MNAASTAPFVTDAAAVIGFDGWIAHFRGLQHRHQHENQSLSARLAEAATRFVVAESIGNLEPDTHQIEDFREILATIDRSIDASIDTLALPSCLQGFLGDLTAVAPSVSAVIVEPAPTVADESDSDLGVFSADPEMLSLFVQEANEHLESAEPFLLQLESTPGDMQALDAVFRAFHSVKGTAGFMQLEAIGKVAHEAESLLDLAREGKVQLAGVVMDLVLQTLDHLKFMIDQLQSAPAMALKMAPGTQELIQRLKNAVNGSTVQPESAVPSQPSTAETAGREDAHPALGTASASTSDFLKVDRTRLDQLINLIGELVIADSMLQSALAHQTGEQGLRTASHVRKITRELQGLSLSLRMVPIQGLFQKMSRLVRDLSRKLNKPVDLETSGGETELDKSIIDQVADPLMHLLRNSLDHGIEPCAADRVRAGKSERATVKLQAYHQGGCIYIEIIDDGRGLNREKIVARALERGLIETAEGMTPAQIDQLIFAPGFSTAEKVTDVSGRGVGMDVVRRNIEALRGSVDLHSEPGQGTRVVLRLPLTLAIIEGMVVRVGTERFIIPTLNIREQIRPREQDLATVGKGGQLLAVRGQNIPYFHLSRLVKVNGAVADPCGGIIVVLDPNGDQFGLLVDDVLGQQQVVIKRLGENLEQLPGIAGGAVMPDGKVGLILDVRSIKELATREPGLA
ncbi:MAG TPA: chemotaxis protein CheA [Planctomycetaceae bacterium]|nr:chemotaxis protein CheA [Planctomycetaceae bacterium]